MKGFVVYDGVTGYHFWTIADTPFDAVQNILAQISLEEKERAVLSIQKHRDELERLCAETKVPFKSWEIPTVEEYDQYLEVVGEQEIDEGFTFCLNDFV